SSVGLMNALAETMLDELGDIIGVIPRMLVEREVANTALNDLRIVDSMHERKAMMAALADGFVALPGGIGTLEEFFEIWTWAQLGMHRKPCGLLNVAGYFDPLLAFLDRAVEERFVRQAHRDMVIVESDPRKLLNRFAEYEPPKAVTPVGKSPSYCLRSRSVHSSRIPRVASKSRAISSSVSRFVCLTGESPARWRISSE